MFTPYAIQLKTLSELIEEYNSIVGLNNGFFVSNIYTKETALELLNRYNKIFGFKEIKADFTRIRYLAMQVHSHYIALSDPDFIQASTIWASMTPLSSRDVFIWSDDAYIIESSNENSACVLYLDGEFASNNFRYGYDNEPHYVIGKIVV